MIAFRALRTVQLGIKSLLLHKMRSVLTMLGIIFGVCSVIAMLAIGEGASYEAQETIKRLGSNNIIIRSVKPPEDDRVNTGQRSFVVDYGLKYRDADRIRETIPSVAKVLPARIIRDNVRFDRSNIPAQMIGTEPGYLDIAGLELVRGRFISSTDVRHHRNVCAITASLADRLFPYQDPLQHAVSVRDSVYEVVGIVRERSTQTERPQAGSVEGQPLDSNLYVPISTTKSRIGEVLFRRSAGSFEAEKVELHQMTVQMTRTEDVEVATKQIETVLKRFHDKRDFEMIVPLQLLRQAEQTKRIFNIVLGSIAAISLIVGGIGIMNIMLATVTERTREIGVRRALGAKKRDITTQFLVETLVLTVTGGLIGVVLGVVGPYVLVELLANFSESSAVKKVIVTPWSVLVAFGISCLIGIVFGLYPANRAANLDPIEALRHE
jgi:putative ABC transport system permease protein